MLVPFYNEVILEHATLINYGQWFSSCVASSIVLNNLGNALGTSDRHTLQKHLRKITNNFANFIFLLTLLTVLTIYCKNMHHIFLLIVVLCYETMMN